MFNKSINKWPCENYLLIFDSWNAKVEKFYTKVPNSSPKREEDSLLLSYDEDDEG